MHVKWKKLYQQWFYLYNFNDRSVVYYCFVAHEDLTLFSDFNIHKVSDVINDVGHDRVSLSSFPDHSVMTWKVVTGQSISCKNTSDSAELNMEESFIRFETRNIPDSFPSDMNICRQLHETVFKLENNMSSQNNLDEAYDKLCSLLKDEMKNKLDYKRIKIENSINNKKRKIRKPWWNTELTEAWNVTCKHENRWLSCIIVHQKSILKQVFVSKRKQFVKLVQTAKRTYWYKLQSDVLNECSHNETEFWKTIGNVGVAGKRDISVEIVLNNGSVSYDKRDVMNKWKESFSKLFDSTKSSSISDSHIEEPNTGTGEPFFDSSITILEVKRAISAVKNNKASGFDNIPVEVLKMILPYLVCMSCLTCAIK